MAGSIDDCDSMMLGYSASLFGQPISGIDGLLHCAEFRHPDEPPESVLSRTASSALSYYCSNGTPSSIRVHSARIGTSKSLKNLTKKIKQRRVTLSDGVIHLRDWTVQPALGTDGVIVSGHNEVDGRERKSCPVVTRIYSHRVVSSSGVVYELVGSMNKNATAESKMAHNYFADGFPENWKQLKKEYLEWLGRQAMQCEVVTSPRAKKLKKFISSKSPTAIYSAASSADEDKENSSASDSDIFDNLPSFASRNKLFCQGDSLQQPCALTSQMADLPFGAKTPTPGVATESYIDVRPILVNQLLSSEEKNKGENVASEKNLTKTISGKKAVILPEKTSVKASKGQTIPSENHDLSVKNCSLLQNGTDTVKTSKDHTNSKSSANKPTQKAQISRKRAEITKVVTSKSSQQNGSESKKAMKAQIGASTPDTHGCSLSPGKRAFSGVASASTAQLPDLAECASPSGSELPDEITLLPTPVRPKKRRVVKRLNPQDVAENETPMDIFEWLQSQPLSELGKPCEAQTNQRNEVTATVQPTKMSEWAIVLQQECICVEGMILLNDGPKTLYRTSPIVTVAKRGHLVTTASGSKYTLVGTMNMSASLNAGIPLNIARRFSKGFPPGWKSCMKRMVDLNRSDSGSYQGEKSRSENNCLQQSGVQASRINQSLPGQSLQLSLDNGVESVIHRSDALTKSSAVEDKSERADADGTKTAKGFFKEQVADRKSKYASALTPVAEVALSLEHSIVAGSTGSKSADAAPSGCGVPEQEASSNVADTATPATTKVQKDKKATQALASFNTSFEETTPSPLVKLLSPDGVKNLYKTRSGRCIRPRTFNFEGCIFVADGLTKDEVPRLPSLCPQGPGGKKDVSKIVEKSLKMGMCEKGQAGAFLTPKFPINTATPHLDKKRRKSDKPKKPQRRTSDAVKELYSPKSEKKATKRSARLAKKAATRAAKSPPKSDKKLPIGAKIPKREKKTTTKCRDGKDVALPDIKTRDYAVPLTPIQRVLEKLKKSQNDKDQGHGGDKKDSQAFTVDVQDKSNLAEVKKLRKGTRVRKKTKKAIEDGTTAKRTARAAKRPIESADDQVPKKLRKVKKGGKKEQKSTTQKAEKGAKDSWPKVKPQPKAQPMDDPKSPESNPEKSAIEKKVAAAENRRVRKNSGRKKGDTVKEAIQDANAVKRKVKWTYDAKAKLNKLVDKELGWDEIAEILGFSAEDCSNTYNNLFRKRRKASKKKNQAGSPTKEITANRGTLKHRKQVREKLEILKCPKPETQDIFADDLFGDSSDVFSSDLFTQQGAGVVPTTPFTKPPIGLDETVATPAWFKTPTATAVCSSDSGWTPHLHYETPANMKRTESLDLEEFGTEKKRKEADRVIVQMGKKMMKGTLREKAKQTAEAKKQEKTSSQKQNTNFDFGIFEQVEKPSSDVDSSEEDEYFSE